MAKIKISRLSSSSSLQSSVPDHFEERQGLSEQSSFGHKNYLLHQNKNDEDEDYSPSDTEAAEANKDSEPMADSGESDQPRSRKTNPRHSLHKGNNDNYVTTVASYSPAVPIPRVTPSQRKDGTKKRTLHRFSNEEHRFIWFYRNDLGCSRGDTYVHFNEYFGLCIRKDSIANTYERLKQKRPSDICEVQHTEPWAVGENYDSELETTRFLSSSDDMQTGMHVEDASNSGSNIDTPTPRARKQKPQPNLANSDDPDEAGPSTKQGHLGAHEYRSQFSVSYNTPGPIARPNAYRGGEGRAAEGRMPAALSHGSTRSNAKRKVRFTSDHVGDGPHGAKRRLKSPAHH